MVFNIFMLVVCFLICIVSVLVFLDNHKQMKECKLEGRLYELHFCKHSVLPIVLLVGLSICMFGYFCYRVFV